MKKVILFATALAALVSCSSDDIVVENNNSPNLNPSPTPEAVQKAIVFSSGTSAITRADYSGIVAAGMLNNKFVVEGVKWDVGESTKQTVFDHYNVNYVDGTANTTTSNSAGWEYVGQAKHDHASIAAQSIKYWD